MTDLTFDEARFQAADHLHRLVDAAAASRGSLRPPGLDLSSEAYRHLKADKDLETASFPAPIMAAFGHVERLLIASDDEVRCVAHLLRKPDPSWFGHLPVIRSAVETLSRAWYLTEPAISPTERARRFANEHICEVQHAHSMLADTLQGLPGELVQTIKAHLQDKRSGLKDWAKGQGLPYDGGWLGMPRRPGPTNLVAQIYAEAGAGLAAPDAVGAWQYSTLSSVAHGLPDGMSQYVEPAVADTPDAHAHLVLTTASVLQSVEPLLTVYEATARRLSRFYRWPISDELVAEMAATRMYFNRAGGLLV